MLNKIVKSRTYVMGATEERGRIPQEVAKGGVLVWVACLQEGGIIKIQDGTSNETSWGRVVPISASLVDRSIKMGGAQSVVVVPIPHPNLRGVNRWQQAIRKRRWEALNRRKISRKRRMQGRVHRGWRSLGRGGRRIAPLSDTGVRVGSGRVGVQRVVLVLVREVLRRRVWALREGGIVGIRLRENNSFSTLDND